MFYLFKYTYIAFILNTLTICVSHADTPTLPQEDQRAGVTYERAVERYAQDCHAKLSVIAYREEEETRVTECFAYDTYQVCDFDYFSCFDQHQRCRADCARPCEGCQSECGDTCDDCKAKCKAGDQTCLTQCAKRRADCRSTCLQAQKTCQSSACKASLNTCYYDGVDRMKSCDFKRCDEFQECWRKARGREQEAACQAIIPNSPFCSSLCFEVPSQEQFLSGQPPRDEVYRSLIKACTSSAECPPDYREALPFLDALCGGLLTEDHLTALKSAVAQKSIKRSTVNMIYNVYGAMYGYQFKKKKHLNAFFYGAGAWLPQTCKTRIKSVKRARDMPLSMTKLRDQVKLIWKRSK